LVLLLLLVAAALFPHASHAQVINWVHRTGGPGGTDNTGKGIAIGPDGNIYFTGQGNVNTPGGSDVFVQSLTPAGAERWTYLFDGGGFDFGYAIAVGADGNSYIAAESRAGSAGPSPLFTILSVDSDGHFRWVYQYGLPGTLNAAFDVKVGANGTIYACGIGTLTPVSGTESMFVVALNPDGTLLWQYQYPAAGLSIATAWKLATDANSNVYVAGTSRTKDAVIVALTPMGVPTGVYLHNSPTGSGAGDVFYDIVVGDDGNIYAAGVSDVNVLVASVSPLAMERWTYLYSGSAHIHDVALGLVWGGDGNLYVGGKTVETDGETMAVISLTSSGVERWRVLPAYGYAGVRQLVVDSQCNVIAAGWISTTATLNYAVESISTDGHLNWTYIDPAGQGIADDIALGPDHNAYAVGNVGAPRGGNSQLVVASFSTGCAPIPTSVVSRKTHGNAGTYDVDLTGGNGIECRSGGSNGDYTLVLTFANTLASVTGVSVTNGTGSVVSSNIDSNDAHNYIVNLTGVTNAQTVTIGLTNVNDSAGNFSSAVSASMGVLLGDVNASRRVDAADVSSVRQQTLQTIDATNFRNDVNASGRIDAADVSVVRQQTLTSLP
jgi:hypothetical protein